MPSIIYINAPNHVDDKGSMGHYASELTRLLLRNGYEVVFCAGRNSGLGTRSVALPKWLLTRVNRLNMLSLYVVMALDMLRHRRDDFGVLNISHEFIFPWYLARSMVIIHDTIQMEYPRSRAIKLLITVSWFLAKRARVRVCDSEATQNDLAALGIDAQVIRVPFDVDHFTRFLAKPVELATPRLDAVWCGTTAFHKNADLFIALARRHPESLFGMVLPAADAAALAESGLTDNLRCFSSLDGDAYLSLLRTAVVLISTSLKEGYGMPAMEALMLGTPVLLSDIAVYRELYGSVATFFKLDIDSLDAAYTRLRISPALLGDQATLAQAQGRIEEFLEPVRMLNRA